MAKLKKFLQLQILLAKKRANSYFDVLLIYLHHGFRINYLVGTGIYILAHFEYEKLEELSGVISIHLIEKKDPNHFPKEILGKGKRALDGFMNPLELQTFPTKAKEVFLLLKRRRWKLPGSIKSYYNTYSFHQEGMKATKEFGAFVKEIGRG